MNKIDRLASLSLLLAALSITSCDEDDEGTRVADQHKVYFVGYVYDGARGVRLGKASIASVVLRYRDQSIVTVIDADGRFVSTTALPTWQDYSVVITAEGYRPFVSRNPGVDVPASLAMTDGVASTATSQTFHYDAYLFPVALKTPKLTITVEQSDSAPGTAPATPAVRASGSIRLRPESSSILEVGSTSLANPGLPGPSSPRQRRWTNDEDLLNQTISKAFADGKVELPEGELVYGVNYQVAVFDVRGYQPTVLSGQQGILAGSLTSRTVVLQRELREPLRIVSTTAAACVPPAGASNAYGAEVKLVFNENIEAAGTTHAEDIDNGVSIMPTGFGSGASSYCGLKENRDPLVQERGTQVTIAGTTLTLAFNPAVGLNTMSFGCVVPPTLTSVVYGGLQSVFLRPVGDTNPASRKSLATLVSEHQQSQSTPGGGGQISGSVSCPGRY
jgi:hypothetical protein